MQYEPYVKTDLLILTLLALEKEYRQYNMPKMIGKNYRTVLRHLQSLKERGLIKLQRTERSNKKGKERNIYTLTLVGLIEILRYKNIYEYIDVVAKNYGELFPLVFGKWQFFTEKGKKDILIHYIKVTALYLFNEKVYPRAFLTRYADYLADIDAVKKELPQLEPLFDVVKDFTDYVLGWPFEIFGYRKNLKDEILREREEWLTILHQDPELKAHIEDLLERRKEKKQSALEDILSWQEWFKSISPYV